MGKRSRDFDETNRTKRLKNGTTNNMDENKSNINLQFMDDLVDNNTGIFIPILELFKQYGHRRVSEGGIYNRIQYEFGTFCTIDVKPLSIIKNNTFLHIPCAYDLPSDRLSPRQLTTLTIEDNHLTNPSTETAPIETGSVIFGLSERSTGIIYVAEVESIEGMDGQTRFECIKYWYFGAGNPLIVDDDLIRNALHGRAKHYWVQKYLLEWFQKKNIPAGIHGISKMSNGEWINYDLNLAVKVNFRPFSGHGFRLRN